MRDDSSLGAIDVFRVLDHARGRLQRRPSAVWCLDDQTAETVGCALEDPVPVALLGWDASGGDRQFVQDGRAFDDAAVQVHSLSRADYRSVFDADRIVPGTPPVLRRTSNGQLFGRLAGELADGASSAADNVNLVAAFALASAPVRDQGAELVASYRNRR